MKIVLTGASGYLGAMLVPRLTALGAELLLVGRNAEALQRQYPTQACIAYEDLAGHAEGANLLVNLAVRNSDNNGSLSDFVAVNVDLPVRLAAQSAAARIRRFVNLSSLHALDERQDHPYAISKRQSIEALKSVVGVEIVTLYLAAVHAETWPGRWSFLNAWPSLLRRPAALILKALRPTLHVDRLATTLVELAKETSDPQEYVLTDSQQGNLAYQSIRRMLDLLAAFAIVIFLWWLLILVWTAIRLQSPGPAIFAQKRVGQHGVIFTCYKFRTMHTGTREAATHEMTARAVTSIGEVLRRTKLDELPQFVNLLKGEMTLIGPRPCLPIQTLLVEIRRQHGIDKLVPGITGLAQVNGIDMSNPRRLVEFERRYRSLQCLPLDARIAVATVFGKGGGDRIGA